MIKLKELLYKTNSVFKLPSIQYLPIAYTKRYQNTEASSAKAENTDRKVEENASTQSVNHCLMMGYSGSSYGGMQYQTTKGVVTVEGILFKAMLENNWINVASYNRPHRIKYQHGSRTDKGVSAVRQCCSIRLPAGLNIEEVNEKLPDDVRVFGLKRVTDNFNARRFCTSRTYTYTLPSIAFSHFNDQASQRDYRISAHKLSLVNDLLQIYKGRKNFHNFTVDQSYSNKSSFRDILHVECDPPFLVDDVEFCVIRIQGKSFMMHQIRRMMGLMLAVIRNVVDSSIFDQAFTAKPTNCPMAPGLGLVLDRLHYDEYDRKYGSDGLYETLTWNECEENVQKFFKERIQSNILQTEVRTEQMLEWLENLLNYTYIPEVNTSDDISASHKVFV